MALFRCYRCNPPHGCEFESKEPRCPRCKAGVPAVVPLVTIHFLYADEEGKVVGEHGLRFTIACLPGQPIRNFKHALQQCSNQPIAVTCPECKKTRQFAEEAERWGVANGVLTIGDGCC